MRPGRPASRHQLRPESGYIRSAPSGSALPDALHIVGERAGASWETEPGKPVRRSRSDAKQMGSRSASFVGYTLLKMLVVERC